MQQPFIPQGYKFKPTDEELVGFFLRNRVANGASTNPRTIYECDLYGKEEPWQVWANYRPLYERSFHGGAVDGDFDLYFFTKLKKNDPAHTRVLRRVGPGEGTWHGNNAGKKIRAKGAGVVIGSVKMFTYKNPRSEQSGKWIMYEYSLSCGGFVPNSENDVVLCRLKMKCNASFSIIDASVGSNSRLVDVDRVVDYNSANHVELTRVEDYGGSILIGNGTAYGDDHANSMVDYNSVSHVEPTPVEDYGGSILIANGAAFGDQFGYIDEDWAILPQLDV